MGNFARAVLVQGQCTGFFRLPTDGIGKIRIFCKIYFLSGRRWDCPLCLVFPITVRDIKSIGEEMAGFQVRKALRIHLYDYRIFQMRKCAQPGRDMGKPLSTCDIITLLLNYWQMPYGCRATSPHFKVKSPLT